MSKLDITTYDEFEKLVGCSAGKHHVLALGVETYKNIANDAVGSEKDTAAVCQLLADKYGFIVNQLGSETSAASFYKALKAYSKSGPDRALRLGPNDHLIIWLSGHGEYDESGSSDSYFLTYQADSDHEGTERIDHSRLKGYLKNINARKILLIIDTCYSGGIFKNNYKDLGSSSDRAPISKTALKGKSRQALTSGRLERVRAVGPSGHSPFTHSLLEGLKQNDEFVMSATQLYDEWILPYFAVNRSLKQMPLLLPLHDTDASSAKAEFVFLNQDACVPNEEPSDQITGTTAVSDDNEDEKDTHPQNDGGSGEHHRRNGFRKHFKLIIPSALALVTITAAASYFFAQGNNFPFGIPYSHDESSADSGGAATDDGVVQEVEVLEPSPLTENPSLATPDPELTTEEPTGATESQKDQGLERLQTVLKDRGFLFGDVDGLNGPATRRAIDDFESSTNLQLSTSYSAAADQVAENGVTRAMMPAIEALRELGDLNSSRVTAKQDVDNLLSSYRDARIIENSGDYLTASRELESHNVRLGALNQAEDLIRADLENIDIVEVFSWVLPGFCKRQARKYIDQSYAERCEEIDRVLVERLGLQGSLITTVTGRGETFITNNSGERYEDRIIFTMSRLNTIMGSLDLEGEISFTGKVGTPDMMVLHLDVFYSPKVTEACEALGGEPAIRYCEIPYTDDHNQDFIRNVCSKLREAANLPQPLNDALVCDQSTLSSSDLKTTLKTYVGLMVPRSNYASFKLEDVFQVQD
ncbi:MAG: caspase family protein [Pseudomonadota bacterium]